MPSTTSPLVEICSAGAARVWIEQCLTMPQWMNAGRYNTRFAALQNTLDEVTRRLHEGQPCHLTVLTPDAARSLAQAWTRRVEWLGSLGLADTGWVTLATDTRAYDLSTPEALRHTLRELDMLLVPDLLASSGGRHLKQVLQQLHLADASMPPSRSFPGGAQAVAALPDHAGQRVMACAQSTEVQGSSHARYLGPFPPPYALATEYGVALIHPPTNLMAPEVRASTDLARQLGLFLCDPQQQTHRQALGFGHSH